MSFSWPDHFPDSCPPADASPIEAEKYRLVNEPPSSEDLKSHFELYPDKEWASGLCKACGLSIFSDRAEAEGMRQRIPALRQKVVAVAKITEESGVVAKTPSRNAASHCTWWLQPEFEAPSNLLVVDSAPE